MPMAASITCLCHSPRGGKTASPTKNRSQTASSQLNRLGPASGLSLHVATITKKCSSESDVRDPDVLMIGRKCLGIDLQRFLIELFRSAILLPVHQHTGQVGKRNPYVVVLSGINRLVDLDGT